MSAPRILLVEDDERLASLMQEFLEREGLAVDHVRDGTAAVGRILDTRPDLVVLDHMLPGEDGLSVLRKVRPTYTGPILMLTARTSEIDQIVGLELGADDYVPKPASPRLVLARIRAHLRRTDGPSSDAFEDGPLVVDAAARVARVNGTPVDLTSAEIDLLLVLVDRAGRPVSRDTLLTELRGIAYDGIDRSIDVRVSALRRKLDEAGDVGRIKTVRGVGYQLARHT